MKSYFLVFLFLSVAIGAFSQSYENQLAMARNKENPPAADIRYLLHYSSPSASDSSLIQMLESIKISDKVKKEVSISSAFVLRRFELAKYMTENNYSLPKNISVLFSKPFSDGERNAMQPVKAEYSDEQMMEYMDYFLEKGMEVDVACIFKLEKDNKQQLKEFAISRLSESGKIKYDEQQIMNEISTQSTDYAKIDSILGQSEFKITGMFLYQYSMFPIEKIKEIRARGGDINAVNEQGVTFLMRCIKNARPHIVSYLINDPEINLCAVNKNGEDVLYYLKKEASKALQSADYYKDLVKKVKIACEK